MKRLIPVLALVAGCSAPPEPPAEAPAGDKPEETAAVKSEAATSTPAGFTDNLDDALATARQDGKYVFACFSGSDWCGWCMRFEREVFSKPAFFEGVTNDYHLVFIDLPQNEGLLSERAKTENRKLVGKYRIEGFPIAIVFDSEGKELTRTGYQRGGAAKYARHLMEIRAKGPQLLREAELARQYIDPFMDRIREIGQQLEREVLAFVDAEVAKGRDRDEVMDEVDTPSSPFSQAFFANVKAAMEEFEKAEIPEEIHEVREEALQILREKLSAFEKAREKSHATEP